MTSTGQRPERRTARPLLAFLRRSLVLLGAAAVLGVLAGCGGGSGSQAVRVDGSSTVYPLSEAVGEEFLRAQGNTVTVGESGTGGGFSKFLRSETDVNDASRPITAGEREQARENGIEFIELPVAYDGIAVVAHPEVDWVDCLSVRELRRIWGPNSTIDNWSEVRDGFPDQPMELYGPGTASGTYDYFTEAIAGESGASRSDFTASEDDNVLVQGIEGTRGALGYFGYAYYKNNQDRLTRIAVDPDTLGGGASCTAPTDSTIQTGAYKPLARPLFIYVNAEAADRQAVQDYVTFYLDNASELAADVGYVPLSDETYRLAKQRFEQRVTGTVFGREDVGAGTDVEEALRASMSDTTSAAGSE